MSVCCCSLAGTKACDTCRNKSVFRQDTEPCDFINEGSVYFSRVKIKRQIDVLGKILEELESMSEDGINEQLNLASKEVNVDNWKQSNPNYTIKWE